MPTGTEWLMLRSVLMPSTSRFNVWTLWSFGWRHYNTRNVGTICQSTWRNISEEFSLQKHRFDNLLSRRTEYFQLLVVSTNSRSSELGLNYDDVPCWSSLSLTNSQINSVIVCPLHLKFWRFLYRNLLIPLSLKMLWICLKLGRDPFIPHFCKFTHTVAVTILRYITHLVDSNT
jgi:hypothetical protein